jgi:tetratricopeptide (TPR) repeat protein
MVAAALPLESLLEYAPQDPSIHFSIGRMHSAQGRRQAACAAFVAAAAHVHRAPDLVTPVVEQLLRVGESRHAHGLLSSLKSSDMVSSRQVAEVARLHHRDGDMVSALDWMEQALRRGADRPADHYFHGLLLQFCGRIAEATEVFAECIHRWPAFSGPWYAISRMRRDRRPVVDEAALTSAFAMAEPGSVAKAEFAFALFEVLDRSGRYADAWAALTKGNAIMAARNPYDGEADAALIDLLLQHSHCAEPPDQRITDGPTPIFIVGLPRSGTTLLDRMLSAHSQVVSAGELRDFYAQLRWTTDTEGSSPEAIEHMIRAASGIDKRELGRRYLAQTRWRAGSRAYYIDKLPNNLQMVGLIRQALPSAPILCMRRDPVAQCFSNLKAMFGDFSPYSYSMQGMASFHSLQSRLINHWRREWPNAMLEVRYEHLVTRPEQTMRSVLDYCGLQYEPNCLRPERNKSTVGTPSSAQVREPIHQRALVDWTHYEAWLGPMRDALLQVGARNVTSPNP